MRLFMSFSNFSTITKRSLVMSGFLITMSFTTYGDTLTIVDGSGSEGDKVGCNYQEISVNSNGSTTIRLNNFSCLGTATTGNCTLDGVTIPDTASATFFVNTPMPQADCDLSTSSGLRSCNSGTLGGDTNFVLSQCNIVGAGSCTDSDSNVINHGASSQFYTSANESCDTTNRVTRTCSDGVLSPSSNTHITTSCNNTPVPGEVVDTGSFQDNTTIGPLINEIGNNVYISDRGVLSTAAPSCVNNRHANLDCGFTGYTEGAKTNDVNAIRHMTLPNYSSASIKSAPLPFGGSQVTSANYDFVVASVPGLMTSDFVGNCDVRATTNGSISVVTQATYNSVPFMQGFWCVVPENSLFYVNVQAVSAVCDIAGRRCNSYFTSNGFVE